MAQFERSKLKKQDVIVLRDARNNEIHKVIFPNGIQVGTGDNDFNSGIIIPNSSDTPEDITDSLYVVGGTLYYNGTAFAGAGTSLTVEESDGSPSVSSVSKIKVSNGTLTDDGSGTVTITTGGGTGGGSGDGDSAAQYVVLATTGSLSGERVLTAGTGLDLADAGAGNTATLTIDNDVVATVSGTTFTGNVGIGGSPSTALHVLAEDPRIRAEATAGNHPGFELSVAGTRKWVIYNDPDESDNLNIKNDSTDLVFIDQTGNVKLRRDSSALKMGVGNDITFTHDGTTGLVIAATPISINSTGNLTLDSTTDIVLSGSSAVRVENDLYLDSDSCVFRMGDGVRDPTFTHDGLTGLVIAATPISIDSTGGLDLSSTTGDINFQDGGTSQLALDMDGTAGEIIMQLKVDSDDLVIKQYDGTEVVRFTDGGNVEDAEGSIIAGCDTVQNILAAQLFG
tara:strand:+ start:5858 stop:7216 length:1359 start_codon:yes stop_codon:yes gene_type:complete